MHLKLQQPCFSDSYFFSFQTFIYFDIFSALSRFSCVQYAAVCCAVAVVAVLDVNVVHDNDDVAIKTLSDFPRSAMVFEMWCPKSFKRCKSWPKSWKTFFHTLWGLRLFQQKSSRCLTGLSWKFGTYSDKLQLQSISYHIDIIEQAGIFVKWKRTNKRVKPTQTKRANTPFLPSEAINTLRKKLHMRLPTKSS